MISTKPLKSSPGFFLLPSPHQPDWRLRQLPAETQEDEAGEAESEVEILNRYHEAEAEANQPAAVRVECVEAGKVTSEGDEADL